MIFHETSGVDLPARFAVGFAQGDEEAKPIRVLAEDGFAAVAAIDDMVNRAGIWHAQLGRATRLRQLQNLLFCGTDPLLTPL